MANITLNVKDFVLYNVIISFLAIIYTLSKINISIINYIFLFYILFIPGFIILILLSKNNNLDTFTEVVVISLGTSIFYISSICVILDFILPYIHVYHPLQKIYTVTFAFLGVMLLSVMLHILKRKHKITFKVNYNLNFILFLIIPTVLCIAGTYALKENNTLIIIAFILLSMLPFLLCFKKFPRESYAFLVWSFALSCVLYNSLFGKYIRVTDNIFEILIIKDFILKNEMWQNVNVVSNNILAMPNVVLFVPFVNSFVGNLVYVYKFIIPVVSSFIPVIIYYAVEQEFKNKYAAYSSILFSSLFVYFTWASITAKMVTAGIYLSLILLLLLRKNLNCIRNRLYLSIFSISLILSHYGTAAIYIISLSIGYMLILLLNKTTQLKLFGLTTYVMLCVISFIGYSIYITEGSIFKSVLTTTYNTIFKINYILNPKVNYGSKIIISNVPMYLQIMKMLYILVYVFIIIGIVYSFIKKWKKRDVNEFLIVSTIMAIFIAMPYIFPVGQYSGGRIWFISLIFVVAFFTEGFNFFLIKTLRLFRGDIYTYKKYIKLTICIFIIIFFIFNSGLASELIWKYNIGPSIFISYPRIVKNGHILEKEYLDRVTLNTQDVDGAHWLYTYASFNKKIYSGENGLQNLEFFGFNRGDIFKKLGYLSNIWIISKNKSIRGGSYIYLTRFNIRNNFIKISGNIFPILIRTNKKIKTNETYKIFTGGCTILYKR